MRKKETGEQRKSNAEKEVFWSWRMRSYCKELQSQEAEEGYNIAILKKV